MDHGAAKTTSAKTTSGAAKQPGAAKRPRSARASQQAATVPAPTAPAPTAPAPRVQHGIQSNAGHGTSVTPTGLRPEAPPPPSSRRELPAPTPLVLPTRLQESFGAGNVTRGRVGPARVRQAAKATSVVESQNAAKKTLALKKAPPPPSSRRASAHGTPTTVAGANPSPQPSTKAAARASAPRETHDAARHTDAQWAAHLDAPRDVARARSVDVPAEPPQLPDNLPLLNLEGEISALRPRPSELPPEPIGLGAADSTRAPKPVAGPAAERGGGYRRKTPSELSVLYQALPTNDPDRSVGLAAARSSNAVRSRGYVPKAPHEFFPPPPPPNKRAATKSFTGEEDDEVPTQARRPAIYPYETQTPTPGVVLTPQALRDSTPAPPLASMVVPSHPRGMPRLPPPPPVPMGMEASPDASWEDREWTDARHLGAIQLGAETPESAPLAYQTPTPPAAEVIAAATSVHADSLRPTALTVPAPARGFPTFGLPPGWAPVAGASVLGAAISAGAFLLPERGQLLVDVSNQSWASLRDAQVYVNDELVCTQSPCAVKVDAAPQRVRVTAPGYQPSADDAVIVTEGSVTLHKIQLGASADTGIEIQTSIPNLQLYVDGRRIGGLPRKVMGLPPGEHTLLVSGGDNFTTEERRIQLEPNQTLVINDLQPKLRSGALELHAGENAKGARVSLDGAQIALPFKGPLEPGRKYVLRAEREGFESFEQNIEVDPNNPVVDLAVALRPDTASADDTAEEAVQDSAPRWNSTRWRWQAAQRAKAAEASRVDTSQAATRQLATSRADADEPSRSSSESGTADNSALGAAMRQSVGLPANEKTEKSETQASGRGSINIVTSPSAVILLDGKPVGKTPKQITVSAGTHSIVLIHANGRKRASIHVEAGANKTIKASF